MSEQPSLASTFAKVAPATILVQVLSFASSIVFATRLGASTETDAFYLALSVPVIAYSALLVAIRLGGIPVLTRLGRDSPEAFERGSSELVSATLVASTCLSIAVTAVMLLVLPGVAGGSARLSSLTREYMVELSPYAVTGAVLGALGSILAVRGRFAVVTLMLAFEPALKSILVLALHRQLGVQTVVIGSVAGNLFAAAVLWGVVRHEGIALRFVDPRGSAIVRSAFALSAPLVISQTVLQFNPLIDRTTAASLGPGSVTQLELGLRLFTVPVALLTGTMLAPLVANWSARLTSQGWQAVLKSFGRVVAAVTAVVLPLVAVVFVLRHEIVAFAYSSQAYTPTDVTHTANVLGMLMLGLLAQVLIVPLSTLFVVRGDTIFPMKVGLANCVLNAGLDLALRVPWGVSGIALSTSITYTILCALYAWRARRRWGSLEAGATLRRLVPLATASSGLIVIAGLVIVSVINSPDSRPAALVAIASVTAVAVVVHTSILRLGGAWPRPEAPTDLSSTALFTRGSGDVKPEEIAQSASPQA